MVCKYLQSYFLLNCENHNNYHCLPYMIFFVLSFLFITANIEDSVRGYSLDVNGSQESQLKWKFIPAKFRQSVAKLLYIIDQHTRVIGGTYREKVVWASRVLSLSNNRGLEFLLHQFHLLVVGDQRFKMEPPLFQSFMESEWEGECKDDYIKNANSLWTGILRIQVLGHLVLRHAQLLLSDNPDVIQQDVKALMEERHTKQIQLSSSGSCKKLDIEHSKGLDLCGMDELGFSIIPKNAIVSLECEAGYYPTSTMTTCSDAREGNNDTCKACNCDSNTSLSDDCEAITGKCQCKDGFTGTQCLECTCDEEGSVEGAKCDTTNPSCQCKDSYYGSLCQNRDCQGSWGSVCPCGQSRQFIVSAHRRGNGTECQDAYQFRACECPDQCSSHATQWGPSTNNIRYFDQFHVGCPANKVLNGFNIRGNGDLTKMQVTFECCSLFEEDIQIQVQDSITDPMPQIPNVEANLLEYSAFKIACPGEGGLINSFQLMWTNHQSFRMRCIYLPEEFGLKTYQVQSHS